MTCSNDPGGHFSAPWTVPGGSLQDEIALTKSDCQVIFDIYDDLAARYPDYVKKTVMGSVFSKDFPRYTFTPKGNCAPKRIAIVTSIHGYEQGSSWSAGQFFRLLCDTPDDPHLQFLRENVLFDVIPVANPWGFCQNMRCNGNGIDLNRNFEPGFIYDMDKASKYWGGTEPCSEAETRMLMQFTQENKDAVVVLDYHNIGKGNPLFYVYSERDVEFSKKVFTPLTGKWKAEYPQLAEETYLGRTLPNGGEGMFADYLKEEGVWVLTMETPWTMPVIGEAQYDATTIRCAVDVLANTLLELVRE